MFIVTILGNNSAVPSNGRHPTSQIVQVNNELYMIDCGEGTQMQLSAFEIKRNRIDHIFISHLHGDHFFGLIALLNTYSLLHRVQPLTIHCHEGLKEIIDVQLKHSGAILNFELLYNFLPNDDSVILQQKDVTISVVQLQHRIQCVGFIFKENPKDRKISKEKIDRYKIPISALLSLKKGFDYIDENGTIIDNQLLTQNALPSKSYAYISDTKYLPELAEKLKGIDLLYHEATFKKEDEVRAAETYHCTTIQAAKIAALAEVKKLMIGHFSAKYKEQHLDEMLTQAQEIFPNTILSLEGESYEV
ncbi:MAG: hypothetical protein RL065_2218 [Bacteroidota bacterium]|jgi:ribonuclease Z